MEMLAYSRPGIIEVLPAVPPTLSKGSIEGMLARTFARIDKLAWDMDAQSVHLKITSFRTQEVILIARYGIESISASSGILSTKPKRAAVHCSVHLPEGKPVEIHLKLATRSPSEWATGLA
jgi:alpha-L-fucosidase 2